MVGASGLLINNLCLLLFTELGGFHYLLSAVMATQCSTLWNFIFTELWVFGERNTGRSLSDRLVRFILMNNASLLLRGPLLALMVSGFGFHYLLANLISLFTIAVIRYVLSNEWIWTPSLDEIREGTYAYDVHGIIGVESEIRLHELEYFRVPELQQHPDIRLRQERRKKPRLSENAIRYDDGLGRFGFALSIVPGNCTEIQVSPLVRKSPHVLYTNIFEPLLRWAFVRKGYALVHGACIAFENQAVMVTAQTDTGKTSTILRAIENHAFAFLSDDMTILGRDGWLLTFPKPLTISAHTLKDLQGVNLLLGERIALQIQSRIHSRSARKIALWLSRSGLPVASLNAIVQILIPPPKYKIGRLIPDVRIAKCASLSHILQIERGPELRQDMELDEIVDALISNAEDAYGFPPYPELAGSLSMWRGEELRSHEREIIRGAVDGCRASCLRSRSYDWWKQLPEFVNFNRESPALVQSQ